MSGIQYEWALNPVTALGFYLSGDGSLLLFVGEGVYLKVYDTSSEVPKLLSKCHVFEDQAIHGISVQSQAQSRKDSNVAIWGGRSFVLLDVRVVSSIISREVTSIINLAQTAPDWILDGAISPFSEALSCIFITAHCAAIHFQLKSGSQKAQLEPLSSPSQSILYSAHVVWTSADQIMVAAGTVFGEIEIITWGLGSSKDVIGCLIFTFTGHEGSIFGVQISSPVLGPDGFPTRLLASCSDDRTIRVWDLSLHDEDRNLPLKRSEIHDMARETGFGDNGGVSNEPVSAERCVAVVMGHASRIWRVKFLTSEMFSTRINVLSFGEDSTCQQWSLDSWSTVRRKSKSLMEGSGKPPASVSTAKALPSLEHVETYAYNTGKHLWSAAVFCNRDGISSLATGGADGKVSVYDIVLRVSTRERLTKSTEFGAGNVDGNEQAESPNLATTSWFLEDLIGKMPNQNIIPSNFDQPTNGNQSPSKKKKKPAKFSKDAFNRYCFMQNDQLLVTTSCGRILLVNIKSLPSSQELRLPGFENNDLKSYSSMLGLPNCQRALLAGANGAIYVCHQNDIQLLARVNGKVAALYNLSPLDSGSLQILVTTLFNSDAHIIVMDSASGERLDVGDTATVHLPLNFVVTSATIVNHQLILGSRNGRIALYVYTSGMQHFKAFIDHAIHFDDAITSIIAVPNQGITKDRFHILISSRNGSYSIYSLSTAPLGEIPEKLSPQLVHQAVPPLGPMIESAWFEGSNLFLYGFRSKNFIVWNETNQQEIASVECGGAHRSYTYLPILPSRPGALAYTKASKLSLHIQDKPSHVEIRPGGHGREIKACAVSRGLIATGAEDTTIRIWRERVHGGTIEQTSFECCAVIQKHTAGIQYLEWSRLPDSDEDADYLFSAGGNEELHVWRITSIPGFGLGVVCESSLTDYSPERDLRIMSVHVQGGRSAEPQIGGTGAEYFDVSLAYSDSTIREYTYSRRYGFQKIHQGRYKSACLTQISRLNDDVHLLTAATDGYVAIWKRPDVVPSGTGELKLISRTKIHQSAILSLDVFQFGFGSGEFILATGGDDNALALTVLKEYAVTKRIIIRSAHAAAITGVGFMHKTWKSGFQGLWTVGGDQRVKNWTLDVGARVEDVSVCETKDSDDVWCSIPDAGGLVTLQKREEEFERCLIWGNGMEFMKIKP